MDSTHVSPVARKLEARSKVMCRIVLFITLSNYHTSESSQNFLTAICNTIFHNGSFHKWTVNILFKHSLKYIVVFKSLPIRENWAEKFRSLCNWQHQLLDALMFLSSWWEENK